MELSGKERFVQHLGTGTISLDQIKAFIGEIGTGTGTITSDTIIKIPAGESIGGHRPVVQVNGQVVLGSAMNPDHINRLVGITADAVIQGTMANIQFRGYMDELSWKWDLDRPIFLGMNGALSQLVPTSGFIQQIATVISSTRILINIQEPVMIGD